MSVISPGRAVRPIAGLELDASPRILVFYKVTCPVCQMAAGPLDRLERAYPGRVTGVGQDPPGALEEFSRRFGVTFGSVADPPPYEASNAYGIRVVPTTVLVRPDGMVEDVVESWDRRGLNRLSSRMAALAGADAVEVSTEGDGLPPFRPG